MVEPAPVLERASVRERVEPPSLDLVVGPNPGCPTLRVFADADDLCAHGVMPSHPYGRCAPLLPVSDTDDDEPMVSADEVAAFGGIAELFVKEYIGSGPSTQETVYLALRGRNGYVLLTTVGYSNPQIEDGLEIELLVDSTDGIELKTTKGIWLDDPTRHEIRRTTTNCTLGEDGGLRCNGACPDFAVASALPELDCAALANTDWARLPSGDNVDFQDSGWGLRGDIIQLNVTLRWLATRGYESAAEAEFAQKANASGYTPARMRRVELAEPGSTSLTILELRNSLWALVHGEVPLVASDDEIRVGPGPGGMFVTSSAAGKRRIQRLNPATHELDPGIPGPCG